MSESCPVEVQLPFLLPSSPCIDPDLLCKIIYPRFCSGWLSWSAISESSTNIHCGESNRTIEWFLLYFFFPSGIAWGIPWAQQAQLTNRMEDPGKRQLSGEPTFLTQVPKESDANTPSALSIAFICSLLHVPLPFGEGALLGQWALHVLFLGTFWGWDKGTVPGGSSHSPAFANVQREQVAVTTPSNKFVFSPFCLCLTLSSWISSWGLKGILVLWHCMCHSVNKSKRSSLGNDKKTNFLLWLKKNVS